MHLPSTSPSLPQLLPFLLLLLNHAKPGTSVDLSLAWIHHPALGADAIVARCNAIPSDVCCLPHPHTLLPGPADTLLGYSHSDFTVLSPLRARQIALGYPATGVAYESIGCKGVPIARIFGPAMPGASFTAPPPRSQPHPSNLIFAARWLDSISAAGRGVGTMADMMQAEGEGGGRWRYADEYWINGTEYRVDAAGDGTITRSGSGEVLNLTRSS